jgi:hypothetical protein
MCGSRLRTEELRRHIRRIRLLRKFERERL